MGSLLGADSRLFYEVVAMRKKSRLPVWATYSLRCSFRRTLLVVVSVVHIVIHSVILVVVNFAVLVRIS